MKIQSLIFRCGASCSLRKMHPDVKSAVKYVRHIQRTDKHVSLHGGQVIVSYSLQRRKTYIIN
jgi:hypothetical protein